MTNCSRAVSRALLRAYDARLHKRHACYLAHFREIVGYQPSIALPQRYHEKMLWRKLFDHSPQIAIFCDKLATKEFIRKRLSDLRQPEILWVGANAEHIPDSILEQEVVVKCNHGCEYNFFWKPGASTRALLHSLTRGWMSSTFGISNHEWGYTTVGPRVFVERLLHGPEPYGVIDINVRAAFGNPILCSVIAWNKSPKKALGYFDHRGDPLRLDNSAIGTAGGGPTAYGELPVQLDCKHLVKEAVKAATILSRDIDYARFDFLSDGSHIFAGEITPYPASGLDRASAGNEVGHDTVISKNWNL